MASKVSFGNSQASTSRWKIHRPRDAMSERKGATMNDESRVSKASSSTDGFFQTPPRVLNQLRDDIALQRSIDLFLPETVRQEVIPELRAFGDTVLSRPVLELIADAEKNLPYLKTWDSWGKRQDELITSEGWRKLSNLGINEGMVSIGYENQYHQYSRPYWFSKYLMWTGSSAWVTCPSLMTDGVATLLRKHLSDTSLDSQTSEALQSAYNRLTCRDPQFAWTTGQWMTERQGGSDVSQTETLARHCPDFSEAESNVTGSDGVSLGPWLCDGFKWFSSATDSSMMVFLARTPNGVSTFMAPMRRTVPKDRVSSLPLQDKRTELNGIQIQRLKNKLGTKALPTAELVLKDVRAHLIGEEGRGTKEIAMVLNVARVHNGINAVGFWGRGLSIVRAFGRVRLVGLKSLTTKSAFVRTLARMHADYKANVLLCAFVSALLGIIEQPDITKYQKAMQSMEEAPHAAESTAALPDPQAAEHIFRLLTPVLKGLTAKSSIAGLAECMECMGGVGYLENDDMQFNIARLYRDANVCSIWEGTTDMMAHDVLRVVFGKTSREVMDAMDGWVEHIRRTSIDDVRQEANQLEQLWQDWKNIMQTRGRGEIEMRSRELMEKLGDIVMGCLMVLDASRDRDSIAIDALRSWMADNGYRKESINWQDVVRRDKMIVFGWEDLEQNQARL